MIVIHAYLKIKASEIGLFLEKAKDLVAGSQAEEGNITYKLVQEVEDSSSFIVVEEWQDEQAVEYHNQTEHFKAFGAFLTEQDILLEPPVVKSFLVQEVKA